MVRLINHYRGLAVILRVYRVYPKRKKFLLCSRKQ